MLRLLPLVRDSLHQDEALYGFWGRLAGSGQDPWLASVAVDKPPVVPYLMAGSQMLFGSNEFALRLPSLAASLLSIPVIHGLARQLYGRRRVALVAAATLAFTPYAILFGAAAFTDALLLLWWLLACYAAVKGDWGWAGLALGLALATKQHALVLAPLVVGLGVVQQQRRRTMQHRRARRTQKIKREPDRFTGLRGAILFLSGLSLILAVVWGWDVLRVANGATSGFWVQGVTSYGGLRLIWPSELGARVLGWLRWLGYLYGWPLITALFVAGALLLVSQDWRGRWRTPEALVDLTLLTFACFYLFFLLLLAFPVWDRYLLPLLLPVGLLLGRGLDILRAALVGWQATLRSLGVAYVLPRRQTVWTGITGVIIVVLLVGGVWAARGRIPLGGDHGAYDGLAPVIDYLRRLPVGTVLYDRWLSWHYDFYLFDAYLYRAGFSSPAWLAQDAAALYDGHPRYVVLPSWESSDRLQRTLAAARMGMSPVLETRRRDGTLSFVLYEIGRADGSAH
jgi:4-amino-4-deoxy-L-arabinose transferase-like glycosyltransferase